MGFGEHFQFEPTAGAEDQHLAIFRNALGKQKRGHALHTSVPRHHARRSFGVTSHSLRVRKYVGDLIHAVLFRGIVLERVGAARRRRTSIRNISSVTSPKRDNNRSSASRNA